MNSHVTVMDCPNPEGLVIPHWRPPDCIGLVLPHPDLLQAAFYSRAVSTFMSMASNRGHGCKLFTEADVAKLMADNEVVESVLGCKGLLYFCPHQDYETVIPKLLAQRVAVALVRRRCPVASGLYQAVDDDLRGMRDLLEYLVDQLHCQRLIYVADVAPGTTFLQGRERAFNKFTTERFQSSQLLAVSWSVHAEPFQQLEAIRPFLDAAIGAGKKTGIVCVSDRLAGVVTQWLGEIGYRTPSDVLVTGYNNDPHPVAAYPGVTTMNIPVEEMVAGASRYLFEYRDKRRFPESALVRHFHELIVRESTR
ncbi:substrate-binding domain-containing protein [Cerasicoccus frondis]|uniref:substrate-binding domain-containing protein n=1 Tax=Cerasicoccus frondis TaxID=490090 RepID=UPI002852A76A|nr:substrate-binding domain-containing protein [Cerasicoccus frondis]